MFKLVAFVLLFAGTNAFWQECTDRPGALPPNSIESPACSGDRCTATRGEVLEANVFMTPDRIHAVLDVRVTAYIFGIGINLPLEAPYNDACHSLFIGTTLVGCPTQPNVQVRWVLGMLIPSTYPAFSNTRVRFELLENAEVVGCSEIIADLT